MWITEHIQVQLEKKIGSVIKVSENTYEYAALRNTLSPDFKTVQPALTIIKLP